MRLRKGPSMRVRLLLAVLCCLLVPYATQAATDESSAHVQTVVLFLGRNLIEHHLPIFLQTEPGRFVSARDVQHACAAPQVRPDSVLAYIPDLRFCVSLSEADTLLLAQRVHALTGRWPTRDLLGQLNTQPFATIAPPRVTGAQARASCTCPQNHAPTGSVQCTAQTRSADTPIGTVTFSANDVDGDALSGSFSYQRDADPVQPGLPASLSASCSNSPGTLQCTVNGTAPGPAGIVQLSLSVSDGSTSLPLQSLIEVLASVPDRVFANGFEYLGCP